MKNMTDEERAIALARLIEDVRAENAPERRAARKTAQIATRYRRRARYAQECAQADATIIARRHGLEVPVIKDAKFVTYYTGDRPSYENEDYAGNREAAI